MCPLPGNCQGISRFRKSLMVSVMMIIFLLNKTYYIHRTREDIDRILPVEL